MMNNNISISVGVTWAEHGKEFNEKIMEALYNDADTTCDNIADLMRGAKNREAAVMAIANLYLRRMVIFDRV